MSIIKSSLALNVGAASPNHTPAGKFYRVEFGEMSVELQSLLGRRPWQTHVFECDDGDRPPHYRSPVDDWKGSQPLRRELQRALKARRRGRAGSRARAKREAAPATIGPEPNKPNRDGPFMGPGGHSSSDH